MIQTKTNNKAVCNTCTRHLVDEAYKKSLLFRFFREPLKFFMRIWAKSLRLDLTEYEIKTPFCENCNRFYKNALKNNSKSFVWFNDKINPIFDRWIEKILGKEEIEKAKQNAKKYTSSEQTETEQNLKKWTKV